MFLCRRHCLCAWSVLVIISSYSLFTVSLQSALAAQRGVSRASEEERAGQSSVRVCGLPVATKETKEDLPHGVLLVLPVHNPPRHPNI